MNKNGLKEAMYESYTKGDKDFTALVTRMKAANIDAVYLGGYHTEGGLILRQMRDQGMKTMLVGVVGSLLLFTPGVASAADPQLMAPVRQFIDGISSRLLEPVTLVPEGSYWDWES